ncbi:MAG: exopolyphosphatase [Hyphomicrobium sp.]
MKERPDLSTLFQGLQITSKPRDLEPLGVIDIGSNSVRLVIYEGAIRSPTPLFNEKVLCGLGRTIESSGSLGQGPTERALKALKRFRAVARVIKVKNLKAFGTAAVRDAVDGPDFISRAEKVCGTRIEVLSGEKEAKLAAQGIRMGFLEPDGIVGDLGGGSLELIDIKYEKLNEAVTLPLGGLRLIDSTNNKIEEALKKTDSSLDKLDWLKRARGRSFYAVGGTWRSLARLHMEKTRYPLRIMQGYEISTKEMIDFCEYVRRSKKITTLDGIWKIAKARREVLPYGALVLERLLKKLKPSEVIFSVYGVREGLLYSLLPPHEKNKDPLLSFCEEFARQRSRSLAHGIELCSWTDQLFSKDGFQETDHDRRLRYASCMVSDIGWRVHPDYRGEHSLEKITHASMSGIDHVGRIFIGLVLYFRYSGPDGFPREGMSKLLTEKLDRRMIKRAQIIGAALRAAHMISLGMPGIIDETKLLCRKDKLIFKIPTAYSDLDGERLRRRIDILAHLMGRTAEFIIER